MSRISLNEMYMGISKVVSRRSSCERRKVGCIIVKNRQIIAEGYNGTPPGWSNDCEDEDGKTKDCVSHAESNAISKAASSNVSSKGGKMYCTLSPCFECSKQIVQSQIDKVFYEKKYRKTRSLDYLRDCGVDVVHLSGVDITI